MGGFVADLLSKGASAVDSKFSEALGDLEGSRTGRSALSMAANQEWEMKLTPGGQAIQKMHMAYTQAHDTALGEGLKKLQAVRDFQSSAPPAQKPLGPKSMMLEFHNHAVALNHPVQAVTKDFASDPTLASMTQMDYLIHTQKMARLIGISNSYGDNFQNATPIIARMLKSSEPRVVNNAHRITDIISNQVRDTAVFESHNGAKQEQSAAKTYMNRAFIKANNVVIKAAKFTGKPESAEKIPLLDTAPTYHAPSDAERTAHRVLDTMLVPFVALSHIPQFFNIPSSSPLPALGAQLLRMDHAQMEQIIEASHITASTAWRALYRDIAGEQGKLAEWTGSPTVGKIMARITHQPGMSPLRKLQLNYAGSAGFHSAIYWASNFAKKQTPYLEERLKEIGIDPAEVLKQGGQLNNDQLTQAVYHFTNNRLFFNKSVDNPLWWNRNIWTRSLSMYHSFLNSQVNFMAREIKINMKNGNLMGLAQFAGTMAVLFPQMAPLISAAHKLLTTGSPSQAGQDLTDKYRKLYKPESVGEWVGNYFELMSYIGTMGVYFNYLNAIKGHRLASAVAGPIVGATTTDIEDAVAPFATGTYNFKPLIRDIAKQTIPVAGGAISHAIAPTTAEERAARGPGSLRLGSSRRRGARRR